MSQKHLTHDNRFRFDCIQGRPPQGSHDRRLFGVHRLSERLPAFSFVKETAYIATTFVLEPDSDPKVFLLVLGFRLKALVSVLFLSL